jgi:alkanesulfonate monooxygenase SsuD/methylene tetrahydromethanopterin reductase-like flavin-dependent oxidoreductase (luciferase family)
MLEAGYERQVASGLFGTPEQLVEQITEIQRDANVSEFICLFSFGDLPLEKAEASMRLFAAEVLPAIQAIETPEVAATRFADVRSARGDA